MPELPEVESTRRSLLPHILGRTICRVEVNQPQLRRTVDVGGLGQRVRNHRVLGVRRRAKYLLFELSAVTRRTRGPDTLMAVHLGMTGGLRVVAKNSRPKVHDHVVFYLDDARCLRFNDARRFGSIDLIDPCHENASPLFARLGVEPFDTAAFDAHSLFLAAKKTTRPLKSFLLDGRFVVGVGNIYASEALWRARLSPMLPSHLLSQKEAMRLVQAVVTTLEDAIVHGGTTLRDFGDADGSAGAYGSRLRVYNRQGAPCFVCGTAIQRLVLGQRSTFFCAKCQKSRRLS